MRCNLCGTGSVAFVTQALRRGNGSIYRCRDCDYEFLVKEAYRDEQNYYTQSYWKSIGPSLDQKSDYKTIFNSYVNTQSNRLSIIKPYLSERKTLIEVGCSTGHFIYNVKNKVKEVVGVDFDVQALKFCGGINKCRTFSGGLSSAIDQLRGEKFDIICCFQVLEHVDNLMEFLSYLKKLSKEDSIIYIEVPNLKDPLLSLYNIPEYMDFYYHEDHLHYFSEKSLSIVLGKAGLKGDYVFYQDYNLLNHMNWILNNAPQKDCHLGLGGVTLPIAKGVDFSPEIKTFFSQMNTEYLEILQKYGYTDNFAFIGKFE